MFVYYPTVATRLTIRFDEALLTGKTPAPTTVEEEAASSDSVAALVGAGDRLSHTLTIVPKTANIEIPSIRQSPKFSMNYAFRDLPIDPRAVRSASVEIYIGAVSSDNFARGMLGQLEGGRLASQLIVKPENLMLVGTVDNITTEHTSKGSEVKIDGRGLQGLLLDAKAHADQLQKLNLNQTVDEVVRQLLGMDPHGKVIRDFVRVRSEEWPKGLIPIPADPSLLTRVNKGQQGDKANLPMKGDSNQVGVWDVITNLCSIVGAVPYFIGNYLWIRPAKSIFTQRYAGKSEDQNGNKLENTVPTPFKDGKPRHIELGDSDSIDVSYRKMVFGRNLINFKMERKFGGVKVPTVKVVSMTDAKGPNKKIEAEWPPVAETKARTTSVSADGKKSQTDQLVIYRPGIKSKDLLLLVAEQIFNEVGRGEMGGSASTKDLASLGGDNSDTDMLTLRPGDAIEFAADAGGLASVPQIVSELNRQTSASPEELTRGLTEKLGFDKDLASVLVGTSRNEFAGLQNVFRISNVKYSWDIASGIGVDFDFQNYVEARYDFQSKGIDPEIAAAPKGHTKKDKKISYPKHKASGKKRH